MGEVRIPFDPDIESIYCSRCGTKCEKSGHMFGEFMMCPNHGEFTIAPVVMREAESIIGETFELEPNTSPDAGKWFMVTDRTTEGMWETCKALDERRKGNTEPPDPRETRVL